MSLAFPLPEPYSQRPSMIQSNIIRRRLVWPVLGLAFHQGLDHEPIPFPEHCLLPDINILFQSTHR